MSKIVFPENIGVTEYGTVRLGKDYIAMGMTELEEQEFDSDPCTQRSYISWLKNIRPGRALYF